jgi:large subunit ribosomal protein L25
MAEISLVVDVGREHGSPASRRLRSVGKIPGIVYGHGIDPIAVEVDGRALRHALTTEAGTNALLRLEIGKEQHLALARELQRHPVRHTVTHIDFLIVGRDEIVTTEVSITLIGDALAVHRGDGHVEQQLFALTVKAKPADIPTGFEVDISELEIGDAIRVGDLKVPAGVTIDLDPEDVVVAAHAPRVQEELEEPEAEEAVEGAAAEVAEDAAEPKD